MVADRQNSGKPPVSMWLLIHKACVKVDKVECWVRETRDTGRCFCPPISDEAPLSSFHTKTDGLQEKEDVSLWERTLQFLILALIRRYLRRGLQISKGNDFFVDKKLDGLLLPVIYITVQFISIHTWGTEENVSDVS